MTCITRVLGVHSEVTERRSTPGRYSTAWVTAFSRSSMRGFQMSPWRAFTTTMSRLAPNSTSRYCTKVLVYSCPSGSCLPNPAFMCSRAANAPITSVTAASTASTATR